MKSICYRKQILVLKREKLHRKFPTLLPNYCDEESRDCKKNSGIFNRQLAARILQYIPFSQQTNAQILSHKWKSKKDNNK